LYKNLKAKDAGCIYTSNEKKEMLVKKSASEDAKKLFPLAVD